MSKNFDPNQNYYFFNKKDSIPLVFIHGVGLDHQMWDNQVDYLNEFSILTYDLLGHGKTPCNKDKLSLKDFNLEQGNLQLKSNPLNKLHELFPNKDHHHQNQNTSAYTNTKGAKNQDLDSKNRNQS